MFLTEAPGTTSLATPSALSAVKVQQQPGLQTPGTLELPPMDGEVMATPSALEAQISMGSYGPATAVQTGATGFSILSSLSRTPVSSYSGGMAPDLPANRSGGMFIPTTGTSLTAEDTGAKVLRLRTALNDKEMELIELREQHMRVMGTHQEARRNYEAALESKDRAISQLEEALRSRSRASEAAVAQQQTDVARQTDYLTTQVRELEADNSEFRRRLTASETAARERAQRGQELEHQLSVARLNAEAAESASRGSQALANQAVQRAERSEDELRRIQQQLEALHEKARHEAGKSGHLTAEVERLKKETEQTKQEKNHSAQLSAAREAELLEANRQLQQRAESLASKLEGEKSTSEALRGRLTSFETMQAELWDKETQLVQLQAGEKAMQQEIASLHSEIRRQARALASLSPQRTPKRTERTEEPATVSSSLNSLPDAAETKESKVEENRLEFRFQGGENKGGGSEMVEEAACRVSHKETPAGTATSGDQVANLRRRLEARDASARRYKEAARALKSHLAEAEASLGASRGNTERLDARVRELETTNASLRRQLQDAKIECEQLKAGTATSDRATSEALSEAERLAADSLRQVEEAELRIHVLEAEEERLVRELDLMTNMVKELEGQLTRAGVVRSEALAEAQEREDALLRRLDKAAKRLAAAEELAEAADQAAEEARLKSQEHERRAKKAESRASELEWENQQAMSDLEAAEARLRAVEARTAGPQRPTVGSTGAAESSGCSGGCGLEEAESRIADLQRDAERLKAEAADAKEGRRKAEEALNKSRMDAEWNAERLQTLQDEMAQVKATVGQGSGDGWRLRSLESELSSLKAVHQRMLLEKETVERRVLDLEAQLGNVQQELLSAKQVLQNETSARRTAETRLSAADSDLAERDRQVASLQHSLQAAHRDDAHRRSALEERVRAAEEALRRKDRELAEGRATVRGLETDLEGLRAQVADREREVEEGRRMAAQAADERRQVEEQMRAKMKQQAQGLADAEQRFATLEPLVRRLASRLPQSPHLNLI